MQLERNDTMRKIVMLLLVVIISGAALIMNKGTNIKKVEDNKSINKQIRLTLSAFINIIFKTELKLIFLLS